MPLVVGGGSTLVSIVGVAIQALGQGFLPWGLLAVLGTLVTVGAIAWAQSDLNFLKTKLKQERRDRQ